MYFIHINKKYNINNLKMTCIKIGFNKACSLKRVSLPFADCLVFSNVSDLKSKCDEMFFSNVSPTKPSLSRPLIRYAFTTEAKKLV